MAAHFYFSEETMIEYDSNGIYVDDKGNRSYWRYIEFRLEGKRAMGGVYIGQSTPDEMLVDLHMADSSSSVQMGNTVTEVWKSTGRLLTVRKGDIINIFDPQHEAFADPVPNDVDGLARLILDPHLTAPLYVALREEITRQAAHPQPAQGYSWSPGIVSIVRAMAQARALMGDKIPIEQMRVACSVLDRAAAIVRGAT